MIMVMFNPKKAIKGDYDFMKLIKKNFSEGINPEVFKDAVEQSKINKKNMEDVMKDRTIKLDGTDQEEKVSDAKAIDKAIKDTGITGITPNKFGIVEQLLKEGYDFKVVDTTFNVNVVDRKALGKLVEALRKIGINPFVQRSVVEGYKYNVIINGVPQLAKRQITESKEGKQVKELANFITKAVDEMSQGENDEFRWFELDGDLAVVIGWENGFGEESRDDAIQSESNPDYALCIKIGENPNGYAYTDMEMINMPFNKEDGDVWDSDTSLYKGQDFTKLAKWYLNEYKSIRKAMDEGTLVLESCNPVKEEKEDGIHFNPKDEKHFEGTEDIKESLNGNPYKDIIVKYFDYDGDFEFLELVSEVIDRIDDYGDIDDISDSIDSSLVYYSDQWKILQHYCNPQDANWDTAIEYFIDDINAICDEIKEENYDESLQEDKANDNDKEVNKIIDFFKKQNCYKEEDKYVCFNDQEGAITSFNFDAVKDDVKDEDELLKLADFEDGNNSRVYLNTVENVKKLIHKFYDNLVLDESLQEKQLDESLYVQIAEDSVPFEVVKQHIDNGDTEFEFGGMAYAITEIEDSGDQVISVDFANSTCDHYGTYTVDGKAYSVESINEDTEVEIDKVEINNPKVNINKGKFCPKCHHNPCTCDEIDFIDVEDEDDCDLDFSDDPDFLFGCNDKPVVVAEVEVDPENDIEDNMFTIGVKKEDAPIRQDKGAFDFEDDDLDIHPGDKFEDEEEE